MLPGSALKVPGGGGGWVPTHFQVSLQLQLRLSWAVTIWIFSSYASIQSILFFACFYIQIALCKLFLIQVIVENPIEETNTTYLYEGIVEL